jgi:ABC-type multidrug transport system fused ATPase/permease subunit
MSRAAWRQYAACFDGLRLRIAAGTVLSLVAGLSLVPLPLVIQDAFDRVIPQGRLEALLGIGLLLATLQIVSAVCTLWARAVLLAATKQAIGALRRDAIVRLYERSRSYHGSHPSSTLHDTVVHGTERVDIMSNALLAELLPSTVLSLGICAVLVSLSPWLFVTMAAVLPLNVLAGRMLGSRMRRRTQRFNTAFEQFSRGVLFLLRAIDLTRIHAAEEAETRRLTGRIEDLRAISGRMAVLGTAYTVVQQSLITIAGLVVLVAGGAAVASGTMTIGALLSFFAGLMLLRLPLNVMMASLPRVIEGAASLDSVMAFLAEDDRCPYTGTAPVAFTGRIAVRDVTFSYGGAPVLDGVSLVIAPGEIVALLGPNGAGKSTLVALILGFYRPQRGELVAEDLPYDAIDMKALRRQIGVVLQEAIMVPGTMRDNLLYGVPDADWDEVLDACRRTGVDRYVSSFPLGYDTPIGEEGEQLSGGQRQRLSIARALLARPSLLILDEPLNHLDEADGPAFLRRITAGSHAPAILLISHRPDVLSVADRIVRVEHGQVVEAARVAGIA